MRLCAVGSTLDTDTHMREVWNGGSAYVSVRVFPTLVRDRLAAQRANGDHHVALSSHRAVVFAGLKMVAAVLLAASITLEGHVLEKAALTESAFRARLVRQVHRLS